MKKIYYIFCFLFFAINAQAQQDTKSDQEKRQQDIQALLVAFISKDLDLTPDEAQKFWPVYNQYAKEMKLIIKDNKDDVLERDERVLNLRKQYKDQFTKIIGAERVNKLYSAEGRFRQILIKAMKERKKRIDDNKSNRLQRISTE